MLDLETQQVVVLITIVGMMLALFKDWAKPVLIFLAANILFLMSSITSSADMLSGLANEQLLSVLLLLVISDVLRKSGLLDVFFKSLFPQRLTYRRFLFRKSVVVTCISGFVNNTPLVAILMPYVYQWCRQKGISPSKVMLPLSYMTILGGTLTLVGTSTNLVVNGFVTEAGFKPLRFFDFTITGLGVALVGILYVVFIMPKFLPDRKGLLENYNQSLREYIVETYIAENSPFIDKTIEQAGLRNLKGLYLAEIIRGEELIPAVGPTEKLTKDDVLIFAGETSTIVDLLQSNPGLSLPGSIMKEGKEKANVVECIISAESSLIGKTFRDANFRALFNASVVAVSRNGERLRGKLGELVLQQGDLLLLMTGNDFDERSNATNDIFVINRLKDITNFSLLKSALLGVGIVAAFVLSAVGVFTLFKALLLILCLIALLNFGRYTELKGSLDLDLFFVLALSLGFAKAMHNSGLDASIASRIMESALQLNHPVALLFIVYLATNVLSMLVSNKAGVAIMFPVTVSLLRLMHITEPAPYFLAIAFAGSAEFMTPYGYQTNLMVYGPGGYRFRDYIRAGWMLSVSCLLVSVGILSTVYNLW
ncbi:MAG: SLC13 family permease [Methylococcaceae bacterium]|jgi:di/tricarboxylate transporter|nr:SLC13 family permease [Methylococcaceae bacterium]MDD1637065.1 SLC13 family permease [Methylococcaceae bacterium]MDD1643333.1 SLC13 family permease [Methylococcaceae bacterium]OYV17109.1 MAG: TrkA-C domain protein [Methylococcaceae bacterium NSM2-1]